MGRFHCLDACRAAAMMLGLFFHGAISFMQTSIPWAIRDRSTAFAVDVFVWVCHTFRMPVFFLLAGFFGRLLYVKLGAADFLRHRAKRLLLPFVVTLVPLMPSLFFLWKWGAWKQPRSGPWIGLDGTSIHPESMTPNPGHLWFLYYLMMVLGVVVILAVAGRKVPLGGVDKVIRAIVRFRVVMLVMAIPTAATLHPMISLSCDTPVDFVPQPRILAYYFVFVAFGWLLHRQPRAGRGVRSSPVDSAAAGDGRDRARRRHRGAGGPIRPAGESGDVDRCPLFERAAGVVAGGPLPGGVREVGSAAAAVGVVSVGRVLLVLPRPPADRRGAPDPGGRSRLAGAAEVRDRDDGDDRRLPRELPRGGQIHLHRRRAERPAGAARARSGHSLSAAAAIVWSDFRRSDASPLGNPERWTMRM
jgi:surface polysaccharide O-acyltransferase-like enzyme